MDQSRREPTPNRDELVALGLLDPGAHDAADREALLRFLLTRGARIEDLEHGRDLGRLVGQSVEQVLRPGPRLSRREVAWRSGVDGDVLARLRQASGLPDPGIDAPAFTEADVLAARAFERLALLFGEAVALELVRVVGAALARIAEATLSAYESHIAAPLRALQGAELLELPELLATAAPPRVLSRPGAEPERQPDAVARAFVEVAAAVPDLGRALDTMLRHHLDAAMQRFALARRADAATGAGGTVTLTVGFVDLVGSTAWARATPVQMLAGSLCRFAGHANDVAAHHGARVVKLIGDEVMFVAADAAAACSVAIDLVEHCAADDDLPPLRGGLATGAVVARDGDYHGTVVQLASRLVKEAGAHTVVVDLASAERVGVSHAGLALHPNGARRLRGFEAPVDMVGVSRRGARAAVA